MEWDRQAEVAMKLKRRGEHSKIKLFNQNLRSRKNNTTRTLKLLY